MLLFILRASGKTHAFFTAVGSSPILATFLCLDAACFGPMLLNNAFNSFTSI
jgi:hypothetical protein